MSSGHVHLSEKPLTFDAKGFVVFYDAAHHVLILLKHNVYYSLDILTPDAKLSRPINFIDGGNVLDVKFSLDKRFLAIQRSSLEVQVVDLETTDSYTARIRQKQGNQLLRGGIIWTDHSDKPRSSQDLVLVTSLGLEFFKVSASKKTCKQSRSVSNKVVCFWYEPAERVVLLAIGSAASHRTEVDIRPYQLLPPAPVRLPRMQLPGPLLETDVSMVRLYGALFCAHIDQKKATLTLHRITREPGGQHRIALQLYIPGSFELSSVDNLLCCHSRESNISMLYDVQSPLRDPFINPRPVSLQTPASTFQWKGTNEPHSELYVQRDTERMEKLQLENGPAAAAVAELIAAAADDQQSASPSPPYAPAWRLLSPDYVLDTSSKSGTGRLWRLCVSLPEVVTNSSNLQTLLPFLLRRGQPKPLASAYSFYASHESNSSANASSMQLAKHTGLDAKEVVLRLLLALLTEHTPLSVMSAVFDTLNEGYLKALVERAYHKQNDKGTGGADDSDAAAAGVASGMAAVGGGKAAGADGGSVGSAGVAGGKRSGLERDAGLGSAVLADFIAHSEAKRRKKKAAKAALAAAKASEGAEGGEEGAAAAPPSSPRKKAKAIPLLFAPQRKTKPAELTRARELQTTRNSRGHLVILQLEIFAHVLVPAASDPSVDRHFLVAVISEYLRSLQRNYIPAQQFVHELLAELLAVDDRLGELYQLLQYRVTADSVDLGTRLLVLGHEHAPLCQLALDMLFRLGAYEQLALGLLSTDKLIPAMRLVMQHKDKLSPRVLPAQYFFDKTVEEARRRMNDDSAVRDGAGGVSAKGANTRQLEKPHNFCLLFNTLHQFFMAWDPKLVSPHGREGSPIAQMLGNSKFPDALFSLEESKLLRALFGFGPPGTEQK